MTQEGKAEGQAKRMKRRMRDGIYWSFAPETGVLVKLSRCHGERILLHGDFDQVRVVLVPASPPEQEDWYAERHLQEGEFGGGHVFAARCAGGSGSRLIRSIHSQEIIGDPEHDDVYDEGYDQDNQRDFNLRIRDRPEQEVLYFSPEVELEQDRHTNLCDDCYADVDQGLVVPESKAGFGPAIHSKDQEFTAFPDGEKLCHFDPDVNDQQSHRRVQNKADDVLSTGIHASEKFSYQDVDEVND